MVWLKEFVRETTYVLVKDGHCSPICAHSRLRTSEKETNGLPIGTKGNNAAGFCNHNFAMATSPSIYTRLVQRGFTLIELLVTLAVAAVLASLAAPAIRDFIVRSKMTNVGHEFASSVLRARNESVNRNICVTLCMSSSGTACTTTGTNWQAGWIGFLNPGCNSSLTAPADVATDMLLVHQSAGQDIQLQTQAPTKSMMFNPRGSPGTGAGGLFKLTHTESAFTDKFGFNICLDGMGRTRTLPPLDTCSSYK